MKLKKFLNLVLSLGVILLLSGAAYRQAKAPALPKQQRRLCRRLLLVYGAALR
jgi:hypothetical protein